jgi:hypothetical protein
MSTLTPAAAILGSFFVYDGVRGAIDLLMIAGLSRQAPAKRVDVMQDL